MNETNERKVLVSIKLWIIVLIVIVMVTIIVGIVIFKSNIEKQINLANNNSSEEVIQNQIENNIREEQSSRRTIVATSRFSEKREKVEENEIVEENVEEIVEIVEEEIIQTSTPIEEVKISKDMDLTVRTGLSRDDFIILISEVKADTSGFFEENAGLIYDVCEKYQINEIFFCGLISAESGWAIAKNHRNTYNYISLMSNNGLIRFSSVEDGMEKAAKTLHEKYLTPGGAFYYGPTLAGVKTKFCPASSTWVNLVYQRMDQII